MDLFVEQRRRLWISNSRTYWERTLSHYTLANCRQLTDNKMNENTLLQYNVTKMIFKLKLHFPLIDNEQKMSIQLLT